MEQNFFEAVGYVSDPTPMSILCAKIYNLKVRFEWLSG